MKARRTAPRALFVAGGVAARSSLDRRATHHDPRGHSRVLASRLRARFGGARPARRTGEQRGEPTRRPAMKARRMAPHPLPFAGTPAAGSSADPFATHRDRGERCHTPASRFHTGFVGERPDEVGGEPAGSDRQRAMKARRMALSALPFTGTPTTGSSVRPFATHCDRGERRRTRASRLHAGPPANGPTNVAANRSAMSGDPR